MPQLNPAPWFITFLTAWFIILILLNPKLMGAQLPNELDKNTKKLSPTIWHWPWY